MKKEKKKLILISGVIVIILIIIALLSIKLVSLRKNKTDLETVENIEPEQNIITENVVEIDGNNIEENSVSNEEEEQSAETPQPEDTEEISKEVIETEESNEEKAINIAKNDWGDDNSVYFSLGGKNSEGKYIVEVREEETTYLISTYIIDVNTEKFTVE